MFKVIAVRAQDLLDEGKRASFEEALNQFEKDIETADVVVASQFMAVQDGVIASISCIQAKTRDRIQTPQGYVPVLKRLESEDFAKTLAAKSASPDGGPRILR